MSLALASATQPLACPAWSVEGVPAKDAHVPWYRAWNLLSRVFDRYPEDRALYQPAALLAEIKAGTAQLWIAWSYARRRVEGACITKMGTNPVLPDCKVVEAVLVGGENWHEWGPQMADLLSAWADAHGCVGVLGGGRRGWGRLLPVKHVGTSSAGRPMFLYSARRH